MLNGTNKGISKLKKNIKILIIMLMLVMFPLSTVNAGEGDKSGNWFSNIVTSVKAFVGNVLGSSSEESTYEDQYGTWKYIINDDNTVALTDFLEKAGVVEIIIPSTIEEKIVKKIEWYTFAECSTLTNITIPQSIENIGSSAFEGCSNLTSIVIPKGIKNIETSAFSGCINLENITLPNELTSIGDFAFKECTKLSNITLPENITYIGDWAFYNCTTLGSITLPKYLMAIEDNTFNNCTNLTSITVLGAIMSIGDSAFNGCANLESITIPNSVTNIGYRAFYGCASLIGITIPNSVTEIGNEAFSNCNNLKKIIVSNNIQNISFLNYTSVEEIIFGEKSKVKNVNFQNCSSLKKIIVPDNVKEITKRAFSGCTSLEECILPKGLEIIDEYAFENCTSLININIPENVSRIGTHMGEGNPFDGCDKLENINVDIKNSRYSSDNGVVYDKLKSELYFYPPAREEFNIIRTTKKIRSYSLSSSDKLTEVIFNENVVNIELEAFIGCNNITKIEIRGSNVNWEDTSYYIEQYIPNENIEIYALTGSMVEEWAKQKGCTFNSIGIDCDREKFYIDELGIEWGYKLLKNDTIELERITNTNEINEGIKIIEFPSNIDGRIVTSIGNQFSLQYYNDLVTIVIPEEITNILDLANISRDLIIIGKPNSYAGEYAKQHGNVFYYMDDLNSTIPDSTEIVGELDYNFGTWKYQVKGDNTIEITEHICITKATEIEIPEIIDGKIVTSIGNLTYGTMSECVNIKIPNTITSIGDNVFGGCNKITSINIPGGITYIGDNVFDGCTLLTQINIPEENEFYCFEDGFLYNKNKTILENCLDYKLEEMNYEIQIPDGVEKIGKAAFSNQTKLSKVDLPNTLIEIGDNAFENCSKLGKIIIPNTVKIIGDHAFAGCADTGEEYSIVTETWEFVHYGLKELNLGEGVETIGDGAFSGCYYIEKVTLPNAVRSIGDGAFQKCYEELWMPHVPYKMIVGLSSVTLNKGLTKIGDTVFGECKLITEINIPDSVKIIGNTAFSHTGINELVIPEGTETIGNEICYQTNLNKIIISSTVNNIGNKIYGHYGLNDVSFTEIQVSQENPYYSSVDGILYNKDKTILLQCPQGKAGKVIIPDGVIEIKEQAFYKCEKITEIEIPHTVRSIGNGAFSDCTLLEKTTIKDGVSGFKEESYIDFNSNTQGIFKNCTSLKEITIPSSVGEIKRGTFENCTSLESVTFNKGIKYITGFNGCTNIKNLNIPEGVYAIYDGFADCENLERVIIPETETGFGENSFNKNTTLCVVQNSADHEDARAYGYKYELQYNIKHYLENIEDKQFVEDTESSVVGYAKVGDTIKTKVNEYVGFSFDNTVEGTVETVTITDDEPVTLRMYYSRIRHNITYVLNGGINAQENPEKYIEGVNTALKDPMKENSIFKGWYNNENFEGEAITSISETENKDITLYAKWEEIAAPTPTVTPTSTPTPTVTPTSTPTPTPTTEPAPTPTVTPTLTPTLPPPLEYYIVVEKDGNNLIKGIEAYTSWFDVKSKFSGYTSLFAKRLNGTDVNDGDKIGTGTKITANNTTYTAVVPGDVTGDGKLDAKDIVQMINLVYGRTREDDIWNNGIREASLIASENWEEEERYTRAIDIVTLINRVYKPVE